MGSAIAKQLPTTTLMMIAAKVISFCEASFAFAFSSAFGFATGSIRDNCLGGLIVRLVSRPTQRLRPSQQQDKAAEDAKKDGANSRNAARKLPGGSS